MNDPGFFENFLTRVKDAVRDNANGSFSVRHVRKWLKIDASDRSKIQFIVKALKILAEQGLIVSYPCYFYYYDGRGALA